MTESKYIKEFLKVFDKFNYRYSKWEVWKDFLYLAATSMANIIPTPEREEREKTYLATINKYPEEYRNYFPELFSIVVLALDDKPEQDFLGTLYHRLRLEQEQKGQYFTPYHISHFMAEINTCNVDMDKETEKKGYITVSDPTCGSGAMLIAFANVARAKGINYQKNVLFFAQDIDLTAALMCYIQLSLLGCPAIVIVGDSLVKPGFHPDNQVWYTPVFYLNHWRFQGFFAEGEMLENIPEEPDVVVEQSEVQKYMEEAGGQFMLPLEAAS